MPKHPLLFLIRKKGSIKSFYDNFYESKPMSHSMFYRKLHKRSWSMDEIDIICEKLGKKREELWGILKNPQPNKTNEDE